MSYFLAELVAISLFALLLGALSLCSTHEAIKKGREDAVADSAKGAYEYHHLQNRFKDKENELHTTNEKLRDANNDMDEERKEFRVTIQDLNDQHHVYQEEIRSLKQHLSNTECDRDEHLRWLGYASRAKRISTQENQDLAREKKNLAKENQKLECEKEKLQRENQQLEASLTEKDKTINDLQKQTNNKASEAVAAAPSTPKYISINDQTEMHQQMQQRTAMLRMSDTSPEQVAADDRTSERDGRVRDLEQRNQTLTSEIEGLRTDLETLRNEHGKCSEHLQTQLAKKDGDLSTIRAEKETADKDSASQKSRIGELTASKEQLDDEVATLQGCVSDSRKDLKELQKTHATCTEHANSQALELTQLRGANGLLQASNDNLTQQLQRANTERADQIREGQRVAVEQQDQALRNLRTFSQNETLRLQARIQTLTQTVDQQQQQIHTLRTNCPKCQDLRAALDAVVTDVKMSDDESRAEMKREVREELRSQVPDDLRRQLKVEVERSLREEFQKRYSDLHTSNSKRIQEQDRLIRDQNAELEKARNISSMYANHAACEKKEGNLSASITKLENDAKILRGNCSRLKSDAQNDREQLKSAQTANEDLRRELDTIKADQRRAQNVNPLQSKLKASQREVEKMKEDRDKARNNCSIYSKNISDLKKKYEALEQEHLTLKGSSPSDGCSERVTDDRSSTMNRDEATALDVLPHEVDLREARDGKKAVSAIPATLACPAPNSTPGVSRPFGLQQSALVAGKKRERADYSDGEVDEEDGDDRKKVRMMQFTVSRET